MQPILVRHRRRSRTSPGAAPASVDAGSARSRSSAPPSDRGVRARGQVPAQGRPAQPGHRPRLPRRPARCTIWSSISTTARPSAPTRAATKRFPSVESGRIEIRLDASRRAGGLSLHDHSRRTSLSKLRTIIEQEQPNGLSRTFRIRHQDGRRRRIQDLHVDTRHA